MKYVIIAFTSLILFGCFNDSGDSDSGNVSNVDVPEPVTPGTPSVPQPDTEPDQVPQNPPAMNTAYIYPEESPLSVNLEGVIPPQCYTKHEGKYNPCMTCHQNYDYGSRPNHMGDGSLQSEYDFSDYGFENHWINLFEDRTERVAGISDETIKEYINQDNYTQLAEALSADNNWYGFVPDLENYNLGAGAFDENGIALDGSGWVAFNYKPLPSTFWPTNGSTDDVLIRLPEEFRKASCAGSAESNDVYMANLALVEMAIKDLQSISVPPINEQNVCVDLNGDGIISVDVTKIDRRDHYVGDASTVASVKMLYPQGTEFMHSVRYVGVTADGNIVVPQRMKELRYMKKTHFYDEPFLRSAYGNENQEKTEGNLPNYNYGVQGTPNEFGWTLLGFIEDRQGRLRAQSRDESLFCMGCHTTIGTTIDQTFAFSRKITGERGWGYINLKGMEDAPSVGQTEGEILRYFKTVGGGDEFRENSEIISEWFNPDGTVKEAEVKAADVYQLIKPSTERALTLNKAYYTIVQDQDFKYGRDANVTPAVNVYQRVDDNSPVLPEDLVVDYDMRLNWSED